jgi:enoyl-CoA hydratase
MEFKTLSVEYAEISLITVNRPQSLNALNRLVLEELSHALHEVRRSPQVRALIVTGAGDRAFVAGADIKAMSEMSTVEGLEFCQLGYRVMRTVEELPVPVVAAVNGFALGGGLELAMSCDLIVASEQARFGQPEINLGMIPGFGGTQRLPHRIGRTRAAELILSGELIDAHKALEWGLVNRVCPPGDLMRTARALAEQLLSKPPVAVRQAKAALRAAATMNQDAGTRFEQEAAGVAFSTADRVEGTKAFLEKRKPQWQGR